MENLFNRALLAWRAAKLVRTVVLFALLVAAIFGLGPWAHYMSWLTGTEHWVIAHTAHPILAALIVGVLLGMWPVQEIMDAIKRRETTANRTMLSVGDLRVLDDHLGIHKWRVVVKNGPPALATNVQMKLTKIEPRPVCDRWHPDYPYPIPRAGMEPDSGECKINPGGSEDFEIFSNWFGGDGALHSNLDTKSPAYNPIQIGRNESWRMEYEVSAANADAVTFAIRMRAEGEKITLAKEN